MSYMQTPKMSGIFAVTDAVQNQEATMAQALWEARRTVRRYYEKLEVRKALASLQAPQSNLASSGNITLDAQRVEDLYAEVCPVEDVTDQYALWRQDVLARIGR